MDEHDQRRSASRRARRAAKAPGRLGLLQRFINSYHDLPREWDRLGTPEKAHAWLQHTRLVGPDDWEPGGRVDDALLRIPSQDLTDLRWV